MVALELHNSLLTVLSLCERNMLIFFFFCAESLCREVLYLVIGQVFFFFTPAASAI